MPASLADIRKKFDSVKQTKQPTAKQAQQQTEKQIQEQSKKATKSRAAAAKAVDEAASLRKQLSAALVKAEEALARADADERALGAKKSGGKANIVAKRGGKKSNGQNNTAGKVAGGNKGGNKGGKKVQKTGAKKRVSERQRKRAKKWEVMSGKKGVGGNKNATVTTRGKNVFSKYLSGWNKAVLAARNAKLQQLGVKGFCAVGGKRHQGPALLRQARSLYRK